MNHSLCYKCLSTISVIVDAFVARGEGFSEC